MAEEAGEDSPHLDEQEKEQARKTAVVGSLVIHEVVREQGEKELGRSFNGLAWSGLAAGLSIGFSFVAQAYIKAGLPEAPWARLVDGFGYSLGFLIVILGQQQLFTETTLTALIPTLVSRTLRDAGATLRVWGIVLAANLIGTFIFSWILSRHGVVSPEAFEAMRSISAKLMSHSFGQTAMLAGAAGWLIGLMVWLLPGAGPSRPIIIIVLTYVVALCEFPHAIAGSVEGAFGVWIGQASVYDYLWRFFAPTMLGNVIAGTALVALLNHAPVLDELKRGKDGKKS